MKRMYQLLAVAIVTLLVPLAASVPASAVATCDIGYTGPNSQNMCTSVETYTCEVTNTNTVTIVDSNSQTVVSGGAVVSGNTTGGSATSGTVSNNNGTVFTVVITNPQPGNGTTQGTCQAAVVVPAKETPEVVTPTSTSTPEALPVTSGGQTATTIAIVSGVVGLVAILATAAAIIYRRMHA